MPCSRDDSGAYGWGEALEEVPGAHVREQKGAHDRGDHAACLVVRLVIASGLESLKTGGKGLRRLRSRTFEKGGVTIRSNALLDFPPAPSSCRKESTDHYTERSAVSYSEAAVKSLHFLRQS
jgi:hypothetical protein